MRSLAMTSSALVVVATIGAGCGGESKTVRRVETVRTLPAEGVVIEKQTVRTVPVDPTIVEKRTTTTIEHE
jgi:hypothetical protein